MKSKWVFKLKKATSAEPERYKARLVIKGFLQRYGMDYSEMFAPVARLGSIRIILANAVIRGMHVHQMDVKTAFLNGDPEDIFYGSAKMIPRRFWQSLQVEKVTVWVKKSSQILARQNRPVSYSVRF